MCNKVWKIFLIVLRPFEGGGHSGVWKRFEGGRGDSENITFQLFFSILFAFNLYIDVCKHCILGTLQSTEKKITVIWFDGIRTHDLCQPRLEHMSYQQFDSWNMNQWNAYWRTEMTRSLAGPESLKKWDSNLWPLPILSRAQFHGSAYCRILCLWSRFHAYV